LADVWQIRDGICDYLGDTEEKVSESGLAHSSARLLPAGTVVLSRTASVGFAGIMPAPMATTQDFANWMCGPRIMPEYLLNCFRAMRGEFDRTMMGSTHQTMYMPDIRRLAVPVPPIAEQQRVVDFLRLRLPLLDRLIEKKRRLIELLQEKRQALITQAVTKGLDPSVPMKDSGVEWLGRIPAHWEVSRLKHQMARVVDCPHSTPDYSSDGGFPAVRTSDLNWGCLNLDSALRVSEAVYVSRVERLAPAENDILYSREGERFGMAALVPPGIRLCLGQRMMLFRVTAKAVPAYLMWVLNSQAVYQQVKQDTVGATSPRINIPTVANAYVPVPPRQEQEAIARRVAQLQSALDRSAHSIRGSMELLSDYRQALISAAVTGQIDVAGESA
jgi:type I restriction enzyme S subunit